MLFTKTDLCDEDNPVTTTVEAESMAALLDAELASYHDDDRLAPCYGHDKVFEAKHTDTVGFITWSPGDGCDYTIAEYEQQTGH